MPMKGRDTKTRVLDIGVDQLSVAGLAGVTVGRLAHVSGMSKSGLFAHFKSKEQLQVDLLDEAARIAGREIIETALQADLGLPRLRALVSRWFGWSARAGLNGGCPLAAAFFELDDASGDVREHVAKLEARWREFLWTVVGEAVVAGHLSRDTDIAQFIWELNGIYLNHHASSRFFREKDADARARHAFEALVHRYQPELPS